MTEWKTINLNDQVRYKMRPEGEKIYREHYALNVDCAHEVKLPEQDAEGWYRDQLWNLATIFGPAFYNGCDIPIDTEIQIKL